MKQFKLMLALLIVVLFASCNERIDARINDHVVVEQIKLVETDTNGVAHYQVKLQTSEGGAYYYTTYKHEAGDTLVSIFEFSDNREQLIKKEKLRNDSIKSELSDAVKKINELTLYNEMLSKVAFDKMEKTYNK